MRTGEGSYIRVPKLASWKMRLVHRWQKLFVTAIDARPGTGSGAKRERERETTRRARASAPWCTRGSSSSRRSGAPPRPAASHRGAVQSARPGHRESGGEVAGRVRAGAERHRRGQAGGGDDAASLRGEQHMLRGTHGESTRRALRDDTPAFGADATPRSALPIALLFSLFQPDA